MSWQHAMLEGLLQARAGGEVDFARAWRSAQRKARARGFSKPRDLRAPEWADEDWLPFSAFFRRACESEWCGRASADYAGLRDLVGDAAGARQRVHQIA